MGLRLTSSNDTTAGDPRDETATEAKDRQPAARSIREGSAGSRDLHSQQKPAGMDAVSDRILQEIVQQARLSTMATGAFVAITQASEIICRAAGGSNAGEFVAYLNRDRRIVDSCIASADVTVCRDCDSFKDLDAPACRYLGARCVVLIPILDETLAQTADNEPQKAFGIFGVFSPQFDAFSSNNIQALQGLSHRIAEELKQAGRFKSAPGHAAVAVRPVDAEKILSARGKQPQSTPRSLAAIKGPVAWAVGVLAAVLLAGWGLNRAMHRRAMDTLAATPPAAASSAAPPALAAQPLPDSSAEPASGHPLPSNSKSGAAATIPSHVPATATVAKPSPKVAVGAKATTNAHAGHVADNKIAAAPGTHVPDLEIENSLDDASFSSSQPVASDPSKGLNQSGGTATNRTAPTRKTIAVNSGSPPAAGNAPSASPPREAVRITRAPGPTADATTPLTPAGNANSAAPDPSAPPPVKLQEWTALAHVAQRVQPDYPPEAKAQHTQGTVVLDVIVGTDGQVESVTPVDGDHPFVEAADKAMHQWRFTPFIHNKQAVRFESHITFNFALP
jgi:TonB family protein